MPRRDLSPLRDEKMTPERYETTIDQKMMTESEVLQEEIIVQIPGIIKLLMKYEWKALTRLLISIITIAVVYFFVGWDAIASGVALFVFLAIISYWVQMKHQARDSTIFIEMKLPGQLIRTGDHSPYSKSFYTTEKRFAIWEVPNALIRKELFHIPGDQPRTFLPGANNIVFVDLFDRIGRTCVLPRDLDVANIAFATNANPMLIKKMEAISEQILLDKKMEKMVRDAYANKQLKASEAERILHPIKIRQEVLMSPSGETKRDIFFELQSIIPEFREKLQEISSKIFILADFLAAKGIYQSVNRPMPEQIRKDHKLLYKVLGLPKVEESTEFKGPG